MTLSEILPLLVFGDLSFGRNWSFQIQYNRSLDSYRSERMSKFSWKMSLRTKVKVPVAVLGVLVGRSGKLGVASADAGIGTVAAACWENKTKSFLAHLEKNSVINFRGHRQIVLNGSWSKMTKTVSRLTLTKNYGEFERGMSKALIDGKFR